ncbi:inositol monophosphatase [Lipomyces tetrasporus]|uniref:Inositol-1-monophosphatase n=1 Tax=Lipomyces tetrasporus TaxID=54092 RepID=A0AAD7QV36_9ASCO|nr:inositol monophosphatase [Lipomyces tetrasporus]KAJ8102014.1 inositol monophosphatase [Lipomyces tetrasporus]
MAANIDLVEIRDFLVDLAKQAGELITSNTGKTSYDDKVNSVDLVTETDAAVEKLVATICAEKYPHFEFMGEESYVPGVTKLTDKPTFIVDPIDGTTNFIHSFPFSCTSLGFAINRHPVVGVVYNPFLNLMYAGIKGRGSFLNGTQKLPLREPPVGSKLTLQNALIGIEWGTQRSGVNFEVKTDTFKKLAAEDGNMVHGFRSLGSAAMNMCAVAAGQLDAYWEGGCYAWDVCAGWVILTEAGGRVVGGNPGIWEPAVDQRIYLAVRGGDGSEQFIEDFWDSIEGELEY